MRIFKNKQFAKWAKKKKLSDETLVDAVEEIEKGLVEAELGGFLFKKRIAREGEGKSSGYRVIIAYKKKNKILFLHGFEKKQTGNITEKEKEALMLISKSFMAAKAEVIKALIDKGEIYEVKK